jgi:hypothetical protein
MFQLVDQITTRTIIGVPVGHNNRRLHKNTRHKDGSSGWPYKDGSTMIEHTVIAAKNYAYIVIKQSPDLETFIRASRLFINDPDYSASLHRICDFSQADLSQISEHDFNAYLTFALKEISLAPGTRVALVAPSPEKSGISDQVQTGTFKIFYQPEDAVSWIRG